MGSLIPTKAGTSTDSVADVKTLLVTFFNEPTINSISSVKPKSNDLSNSSNIKVEISAVLKFPLRI